MTAYPIPPAGVAKAVWKYTSTTGHECRNIHWYQTTTSWDQGVFDAYSGALAGDLKDCLSTNSHYHGVDFYISDGSMVLFGSSTNGAGDGVLTGAMSAPTVQALTKKKTLYAGRKNQGRYYLPDVPEGEVDDSGHINTSSGYFAALASLASAMTGSILTPLPSTNPILFELKTATVGPVIQSYTVEEMVANQRRRYSR